MEITIWVARDLTLGAIDGVAGYYETVESRLQTARAEEKEKIHAEISGMKLEWEDEIAELDLAMQVHGATFDMLLPNYFRHS